MAFQRLPAILIQLFLLLTLWVSPLPLQAEVEVNIRTLLLEDPSLARLQRILELELEGAETEMEDLISTALDRPLFFQAFADAGTFIPATRLFVPGGSPEEITLSTNSALALQSKEWNPEDIQNTFDNLQVEDDLFFGASASPFAIQGSFPLPSRLPRTRLMLGGGYTGWEEQEYSFTAWNLYGLLGWRLPPMLGGKSLRWGGLEFQGGYQFTHNAIRVVYQAPRITQEFTWDPHGTGPLFAYPLTVVVDATEVEAEFAVTNHLFPFYAGTSIEVGHHFIIQLGGGVIFPLGGTSLSLKGDSTIGVLGLSDLSESDISLEGEDNLTYLTLSGSTAPYHPPPYVLFGSVAVTYRLGPLFLHIPLGFQPATGISAGISLGVGL